MKRAQQGSSSQAIVRAIREHGIDNFEFEVLETVDTPQELDALEAFWIAVYDSMSPNGYNETKGGRGTVGYNHTDPDKQCMRELKRGMYFGTDNPFYGKTHSPEQIAKWRQDRVGRKLTEEWKRAISETRKRRKIINLDTGEVFESARHICRYYGKDPDSGTAGAIAKVCQKQPRYRTCFGFRFEYYDPATHDNTVPNLRFLEEGVTTIRKE